MSNRGVVEDNKGIFVSYRRDDTTAYAGWLADMLDKRFGKQNVFRDIDSIEPGFDFVEAIERALAACEVMLVVIGKNWTTRLMEHVQTEQEDYTRLEVATALKKRDVRVMPVLVQGASMPDADELPDDLVPLSRRHAFELHDSNWNSDVQYLITKLERVLPANAQEQKQTRTVGSPKSVTTPNGTELYLVDSFEDIEYLSSEGKALVIVARAEKGWGERNVIRGISKRIVPYIESTAKAEGVVLCFSNVGGIVNRNDFAIYLEEHGLRHLRTNLTNSFLLFEKGRLIRYKKTPWFLVYSLGQYEPKLAKELLEG
jgi:hypothetical protein